MKPTPDIRKYSSFDRDERINEFKVNALNEDILERMNNSLGNVNNFVGENIKGKSFPSIIITGMPRSGTTLLSQVLPARYDIAYVSNLMARFYGSPLIGAWLQKQLIPDDIHSLRCFDSKHGVTRRIFEPHEFGFFWSKYLSVNNHCHAATSDKEIKEVDFPALNSDLGDISKIFERPVVYKCAISPFFLLPMLKNMNVFFVHIVRNKQATIKSILDVRKERLGSEHKWWSIRPPGWEDWACKTPEEQVAWQYEQVINAITETEKKFGERFYRVTLDELVKRPETVLESCMHAYTNFSGYTADKVGVAIDLKKEQS